MAGGAWYQGDFETSSATTGGVTNTITGDAGNNTWATMWVPFSFNAPIQTAVINFSALCNDYGNSWGAARIDIFPANGGDIEIFCEKADSTDPQFADYNYTASQTPVPGATISSSGYWSGYTDFSALVAGQTRLHLDV